MQEYGKAAAAADLRQGGFLRSRVARVVAEETGDVMGAADFEAGNGQHAEFLRVAVFPRAGEFAEAPALPQPGGVGAVFDFLEDGVEPRPGKQDGGAGVMVVGVVVGQGQDAHAELAIEIDGFVRGEFAVGIGGVGVEIGADGPGVGPWHAGIGIGEDARRGIGNGGGSHPADQQDGAEESQEDRGRKGWGVEHGVVSLSHCGGQRKTMRGRISARGAGGILR